MMDVESAQIIKELQNEIELLRFKLDRSESHRATLEELMSQTQLLLETASAERLTEEKKKQLDVFSKFVPKDFLKSLSKEDTLDIVLGDHVEREMTIMFTDICGFATMSETMTPTDNFNFINSFFKRIEPPIHEHGGFIDKFIGDAIMALFYKSQAAIQAGINMHKALEKYNLDRAKSSYRPIEIGVGIHSGKLMLGIVGVETRMQSTVISDAVNLASRLESLTRYYHSTMLISGNTLAKAGKEHFNTRYLGKIKVYGKKDIIKLYEVLNAESDEIAEKKLKIKDNFEHGVGLYSEKKFEEAKSEFAAIQKIYPEDTPTQLYLKRIHADLTNPHTGEWSDVEVMKEK